MCYLQVSNSGYFHNMAVVSGQAHHSQIKMQLEYTNPSTAGGLTVTDVTCPVAFRFCPFCRSGHSASSDGAKEPLLPYEYTQNSPEILYDGIGYQVLNMVRFYENVTYRVFLTFLRVRQL
jgi:hypothetical protein